MIFDEKHENAELSLQSGKQIGNVSYEDALENYAKNTNWWTVFSSFDLIGFSPSSLWISQQTNIPVKEVVEALEGLTVLGYLQKVDGEYAPIPGKSFIHYDVSRKPKAEVLENHALISSQILNHLHGNGHTAIDHRCFAGNMEILQELYDDIEMAFTKAYESSKTAERRDMLFKMSFTAVDVLDVNKRGKGTGV